MNSESDFPISNHLLLSELRLTIDSVITFIDNASGQNDSFEVTETVQPLLKYQAIKFVIISRISQSNATLEAHYDKYSHVIANCSYLPLKSSMKNIELKTQGDLYDFLLITLCPSLCLLRSIMYMIETCKKAIDPAEVDRQLHISISSSDEDKTLPNLTFCVKGQNAFVDIRLSRDQSHLVCFLNGNVHEQTHLPSIISPSKKGYLEWAFDKSNDEHKVPHPKTSEGMRIIFGLLGIDYVKKVLQTYEIKQQQIDSLKMAKLELSDASDDGSIQEIKQQQIDSLKMAKLELSDASDDGSIQEIKQQQIDSLKMAELKLSDASDDGSIQDKKGKKTSFIQVG
jgi:hypothetical protein